MYISAFDVFQVDFYIRREGREGGLGSVYLNVRHSCKLSAENAVDR